MIMSAGSGVSRVISTVFRSVHGFQQTELWFVKRDTIIPFVITGLRIVTKPYYLVRGEIVNLGVFGVL